MTYQTDFDKIFSEEVAQSTTSIIIDFTIITGKIGISIKNFGYITHNFEKYQMRIGYFAMIP